MENNKNLNPNAVTFDVLGDKLRVFYDDDCIRIVGTDIAEILGFANGRNAIARYCPGRISHPMQCDSGTITRVSAITMDEFFEFLRLFDIEEPLYTFIHLILYFKIAVSYETYMLAKSEAPAVMKDTMPRKPKPDKRAYRDWYKEKNPIRRMAKRILSGFPLEDGTPINRLFDFDDAFLSRLARIAEMDDEACEPYLEALALD